MLTFPTSYTAQQSPQAGGGGGVGESGYKGEESNSMHRTPSMPDLQVLNDTFVDLLTSLGISHEYQEMYMKLPAHKKFLISHHKGSVSVCRKGIMTMGGRKRGTRERAPSTQ